MRYAITLSYDGAGFSGWQVQPNAETVQQCLESALSKLLRVPVSVVGAGRTDTGVSAVGYVAHFDVPEPVEAELIGYKLNAILPASITVHSLREADPAFHARFSARRREYTYFLHRCKDPFAARYSLRCGFDLDVEAMNRAAALLCGTHDFSCFEKVGGDNKTSLCTVTEAAWHPYTPTHAQVMPFAHRDGDYLYFRIAADRFLRNMVRAVVGTLLEVGRGKRSLAEFAALLEGGERSAAGESVSGHALFLSEVDY